MSRRDIGAGVVAFAAGSAGFAALALLGYVLYLRLWGGESPAALAGIELIFGAAGLYAGWILGMLVFSAIRGPGGGAAA